MEEAAKLAAYLIEEKSVTAKVAYIIASRKYKIPNWHDVQKYYNQYIKTKQLGLL